MRTSSQLYTVRYLSVPMARYDEMKASFEGGFMPPPLERKGACPRGVTTTCHECHHFSIYMDEDGRNFRCLNMTYDNIMLHGVAVSPTSDGVMLNVIANYKDMVLLDEVYEATIQNDALDKISHSVSYYDILPVFPHVSHIIASQLTEAIKSDLIHLEKQ